MTMSSVLHQTLTAYEFWQLPDSGVGRELRRGEVIETMPPGGQHGAIAVILATLLRLWTKRTIGGYVGQVCHSARQVPSIAQRVCRAYRTNKGGGRL